MESTPNASSARSFPLPLTGRESMDGRKAEAERKSTVVWSFLRAVSQAVTASRGQVSAREIEQLSS